MQKITASYQMQYHMAILIAYCIEKKTIKHCSCWKTTKTHLFI